MKKSCVYNSGSYHIQSEEVIWVIWGVPKIWVLQTIGFPIDKNQFCMISFSPLFGSVSENGGYLQFYGNFNENNDDWSWFLGIATPPQKNGKAKSSATESYPLRSQFSWRGPGAKVKLLVLGCIDALHWWWSLALPPSARRKWFVSMLAILGFVCPLFRSCQPLVHSSWKE